MRSQRISVVSVHPLTEWTILPFPSQPKLVLIYRPRRDGGLSWPGSWLHIEINVRHRELNPVTFTHLCYCRRHYTSYKSPYTASVIQPSIVSTFLRPVYRAPDLFTSASEDAYFGKKHLGTVDVFVVCTWYEYGPRAVYCPAAYVRIVIREAILRPYFVQPLLCMSH